MFVHNILSLSWYQIYLASRITIALLLLYMFKYRDFNDTNSRAEVQNVEDSGSNGAAGEDIGPIRPNQIRQEIELSQN